MNRTPGRCVRGSCAPSRACCGLRAPPGPPVPPRDGARNPSTRSASCTTRARSAQESALTTMSSWSSASIPQTARVLAASPLPPWVRTFSATVLTSAARRHHRSADRAQACTVSVSIRPSRHAGPDSVRAKPSTACQLSIPAPSRSSRVRSRSAYAGRCPAITSQAAHRSDGASCTSASAKRWTDSASTPRSRAESSRRSARTRGVVGCGRADTPRTNAATSAAVSRGRGRLIPGGAGAGCYTRARGSEDSACHGVRIRAGRAPTPFPMP